MSSLLPLHSHGFFFNDTATTEIYTLSLHDALPIFRSRQQLRWRFRLLPARHSRAQQRRLRREDRKSTRLNSSHLGISYAVFCLKKKNNNKKTNQMTNTEKPDTRPVTIHK